MRAARALLVSLTSLALAAGPVTTAQAAPAAASASALTPSPIVGGRALDIHGAASILGAGNRMFVSDRDGDRVLVFDTNANPVATLSNLPKPAAMVASADGATVFVTLRDAGKIAAIDVATATEGPRIDIDACPENLALSSGRLFYTWGCTESTGGLASVDPANPAEPVPAAAGVSRATIAGRGNQLVVAPTGSNASSINSYTTDTAGALTPVASTGDVYYVHGLAITPDGSRVIAVDLTHESRAAAFTLPGLTREANFALDSYGATALAVSPDGARTLFGLEGSHGGGGPTLALHNTTTRAPIWTRYLSLGTYPHSATWDDSFREAIHDGVSFSADGASVFALMRYHVSEGVTLVRAAAAPTATKVTVTAQPRWKQSTIATAKVTGASTGTVQFFYSDGNYSSARLGTAPVKNGVATLAFAPRGTGRVAAAYLGDANHLPSIGSGTVKTASMVRLTMKGDSEVRKGIRRYASYEDVAVSIQLKPATSRTKIVINLWKWKRNTWVPQGGQTMRADKRGRLDLEFYEHIGGTLSFTAYFPGDATYAPSGYSGQAFTMAR